MSRFVLDASVALAWCFPDENSALAQQFADLFKQGRSAVVTAFWPNEVLNALLAGERRKRISTAQVRSFLRDLALLPIGLVSVPSEIVFGRIQSVSREYGLTAYDAAYLDLSLAGGLPLATLDEDLRRACKKAGAELLQP